ncbi:MAG: NADH-quinone oxidoreductase subunit L [Anaerolineaceae bacterium]|nr:NADH-quinone oxidoreductase subunit L [Anaerolineaceae bacterium]
MLLQETVMNSTFQLVPLVVLLPLLGILLNWLFGKRLGEKGIGSIASLAAGGSFVVSVMLALALLQNPEGARVPLFTWISIGTFDLSWAFRVDTLAVTMMLVVSGVSTLIHIYSIGYMHEDVRHKGDPNRFRRFFIFLNLFVAAMMILVSADNFLMLFVGWEGVGLCSYLLIGFWFEKGAGGLGNAKAAKKAFTVNRIGDFGLLIAIFLIFWNFGTLNFSEVFAMVPAVAEGQPGLLLAITLFMLLGVTGKSAQIPLYVWLPDAMAGPTPVSALIHAATMVTAGVYLMVRSQVMYMAVPAAQEVVAWVGALTALFAGLIALGQFDIKKVLAYSTISQLGFMVAAVGLGAEVAAMFHLTTHAFFKALLFLSAGSVILGMEHGLEAGHHGAHGSNHDDPQDMRNMGAIRKKMPVTFVVYLIGALALAGIAPFAGFFSKDEILVAANQGNTAIFIILVAAAFLTAFYMGRQVLMVFFGDARTDAAKHAKESSLLVTMPLMILALLSVLGGALNLPGVHTFEHWLEETLIITHPAEFIVPIAVGSLAVALVAILLAYLVYGRKPLADAKAADPLAKPLGVIFRWMNQKFLVDELYQAVVIGPYHKLADFFANPIDQGLIDGVVNGLGSLTNSFAGVLRKLQTGFTRTYALSIFAGLILILVYILTRI